MKKIIKTVICIAALISAVSCMNNTKTLLPNVSGKAGEVIIVVGKDNWEGNLGNEIGGLLARDCEYLPQREPLYSLVNLSPGAFSDMFKLHRNIVIFNIDSTVVKQGVVYRTDVWAHPQCVIQVNASCADSAIVVLEKNGENITGAIEQAERDRVIANSILYEEKSIQPVLAERFGGIIHFPNGYSVRKVTDDFVWVACETQYTNQGVFIYKSPVGEDPFTLENLVARRNEYLQKY